MSFISDHFPSPPFPSYTSGHSTFGKASSQVLTHFYGTDAITFTARSDTEMGVFRKFQSLAACADEVGMSRVYGGFHYIFDNQQGKATGGRIGVTCVLEGSSDLIHWQGLSTNQAVVGGTVLAIEPPFRFYRVLED